MSVINTNYLSLVAQNNLQKSQSALGSAIERLSSGLRINSAKDDAAGQAIANRMTSQVKGLNQAQRNANDGISVAQTAEGALNQVNDNLQRVRELTVQSQNATNSADDKASIQAEIKQRLTEIDRISKETDFNGVKVLASDQNLKIQVGANDNEQIAVGLKKIDKTTLGLASFDVTKSLDAQPELGDQVGFNSDLGAIFEVKNADGTVAAGIYAAKADDGSLTAVRKLGTAATADNGGFTAVTYTGGAGGTVTGLKATLGFVAKDAAAADFSNGAVAFLGVSGGDTYQIANAAVTALADTNAADTIANTSVAVASYKVIAADSTGTGVKLAVGGLARLDTALKMVDTLRSDLGAIQNRFESAITNLQTNSTNLQAARSRIEDADYAVEVANMSKNQILQQAGTSVLAQANQIPQGVLSLLR